MGSIVNSLGAWLLSASIAAGLLLAASWLGAALLRRATPAARHQIWALGAAGALAMPLLCRLLPLPMSWGIAAIDGGRPVLARAVFVTGGPAAAAETSWIVWLAAVWAVGALLVSLRVLRSVLAARRLSRAAQPAGAAAWSALREAAASLGIARAVRLGRSDVAGSPMTVGALRPLVLLPAAAEGWSAERLRAILMHELGHVRRHDNLIQLGAQLATILYWWNPLAWLATARLRSEREQACDDLVLAAGIRPSSYASDLLHVARCVSAGAPTGAAAAGMLGRSGTEVRIRRILDAKPPGRPPGARFRLLARGATLAIAVALASAASPVAGATASASAAERKVSLGTAFVDGDASQVEDPIDLALVEQEVQRHAGPLQKCFERRLRARPGLKGVITLQWTITGTTSWQTIQSNTLHDEVILSCLTDLSDAVHFPAPRADSVRVLIPFVFGVPPKGDGC